MTTAVTHKSAISIRNLCFSYDRQEVLSDVNLEIEPFDSICVVGPNGGGKSTLIKLMVGLLHPYRGEVRVFGEKPELARLRIGYVPQYADYDQQFPISVTEVVSMGCLGDSLSGRYTSENREQIRSALGLTGLLEIANRPFSDISGGQRQRVLIARALASQGDILILDEPTANIDHESELQFFDLLNELNKRMTILMVTHEVGFASTFFKRIACVNKQVVIHPTSALTGDLIREMYGGDLQMIRHDHCCSSKGHQHD
jgi:zinc transport system ATP-binding protein